MQRTWTSLKIGTTQMTQNKQSEPSTPSTPPTPLCSEKHVEDGGLGEAGGRLEVCLLLSRHCGGVWRGQWTGPGSGGPADVLNTSSSSCFLPSEAF